MIPASFLKDLLLPIASECLLILHGITLQPTEGLEDRSTLIIDIAWNNETGRNRCIFTRILKFSCNY